ncbi:MAG: peptidylprolyl isomerase [Spirochaetaceae bacterium]|nr:peptidylprolyl isomerase [Spirochaetaceae bacterium]
MKITTFVFAATLSAVTAALEAQSLADGLYARIATSKGEIIVQLEYEKTPLTVINFVGLAEGTLRNSARSGKPYYDGLKFHRVVDNFMIQGGDPEGSGRGGPGYTFPDEIDRSLRHSGPGILSMANAGPGTNGSQFFITHLATPWLDGKHTVFGRVVQGQDVVNKIRQGDTMQSVTIIRQGAKAAAFTADQAAFDKALAGAAKQDGMQNVNIAARIQEILPGAQKTVSGIFYKTTKAGTGAKPTPGSYVTVHYTGLLLDGTVFDSSENRAPIEFQVGRGRVIKAWDEMIADMKEGEKRTFVLPPELGYGARGAGPIPPNAHLLFEVELITAKR